MSEQQLFQERVVTIAPTKHHFVFLIASDGALLGLDDNRLPYYHAGRFKQLSQFGGQVIKELLG